MPDDERNELSEATDAEQIFGALTGSFWYGVGRDTAPAYIRRKQWLYRRVESIEFVGRRCLRRKVSIDFERPDGLPDLHDRAASDGCLVPVSVLRQWPPPMDFDFRGPDGEPISLYKGTTNKQLDFGLLNGFANELGIKFDYRLARSLALLVAFNTPPKRLVEDVIRDFRGALELAEQPGNSQREAQIEDIANLAAQLANSSILWAPVRAASGEDCIVKFSYLDHYTRKRTLRQLLIACSWHDRTLMIPLIHAGRHARYHLEVSAEAGIEFVRAGARNFPPTPPGRPILARASAQLGGAAASSEPAPRQLPAMAPTASPLVSAGPRRSCQAVSRLLGRDPSDPGHRSSTGGGPTRDDPALSLALEEVVRGSSAIADRRVHIFHPPLTARSHRILLLLELAASREGFISHCLAMSVALALVMSAAFAELQNAAKALPAFAVLLAAAPLVLGYLLVRAEDPLEREGIIGVRAMAIVSGALPILGVLLLVLFDSTSSTFVRLAWATLTVVSWIIALGLGWSWSMAASPPRATPREHRVQNITSISASLCAIALLGAGLLDALPYRRLAPADVAAFLRGHEAMVIAVGALLVVGASALHGTIGGIRRRLRYGECRRGDGLAGALLLAGGGVWIWGTVVAGVLVAWEAMTIEPGARAAPLIVPALTIVNATLPAAAIVMLSATVWILARRRDIVVKERVLGDPWLALAGLLLAAPPLLLRALSVASYPSLPVAPGAAWVGFALWLLCLAALVRDPVKDALGLRPIGRPIYM